MSMSGKPGGRQAQGLLGRRRCGRRRRGRNRRGCGGKGFFGRRFFLGGGFDGSRFLDGRSLFVCGFTDLNGFLTAFRIHVCLRGRGLFVAGRQSTESQKDEYTGEGVHGGNLHANDMNHKPGPEVGFPRMGFPPLADLRSSLPPFNGHRCCRVQRHPAYLVSMKFSARTATAHIRQREFLSKIPVWGCQPLACPREYVIGRF
jgi:hypothetical protein